MTVASLAVGGAAGAERGDLPRLPDEEPPEEGVDAGSEEEREPACGGEGLGRLPPHVTSMIVKRKRT